MANITASMVKELRERTSLGMMDCKNALSAADGDLESLPIVSRVKREGALSRVYLKPGARPRELMEHLQRQGIAVEHFEVARTSLEEIFVRTVHGRDAGGGA